MGMTIDEAIAHGKEQLEIFGGEHREFIEMAVKALEQEPIIDKIRAEIIQVANQEKFYDEKWALGLRYAVKIINKYKAETEDT